MVSRPCGLGELLKSGRRAVWPLLANGCQPIRAS
jgi:hypothetical protein